MKNYITPDKITEALNLKKRPLSYSSLKAFIKSPAHFIQYRLEPFTPSPAMALGSLVDCLLLSPDDYEKRYFHFDPADRPDPAKNFTATVNKEWKAKQTEEAGDRIVIDEGQLAAAEAMTDNVLADPASKAVFDEIGTTQRRLKWTDKATGLPLVGYSDGDGDGFIMDLKTAAKGSPDDFARQAFNLGYHIQAAMYIDAFTRTGLGFPEFKYVVVETSAPYAVSVFTASQDFIDLGRQEYQHALAEFKYIFSDQQERFAEGYNFRNVTGAFELDLPGYAKRNLQEM